MDNLQNLGERNPELGKNEPGAHQLHLLRLSTCFLWHQNEKKEKKIQHEIFTLFTVWFPWIAEKNFIDTTSLTCDNQLNEIKNAAHNLAVESFNNFPFPYATGGLIWNSLNATCNIKEQQHPKSSSISPNYSFLFHFPKVPSGWTPIFNGGVSEVTAIQRADYNESILQIIYFS